MQNRAENIHNAAREIFDLKTESITEIADYIQPTVNLQPRINYFANTSRATSGTTTLTFPTDKDVIIYRIQYSYTKNATCDNATGAFNCNMTIGGVARTLLQIALITLTQEKETIIFDIPQGIKPDRGGVLTMGITFTAGACVQSLGVIGCDLGSYNRQTPHI